MQAAMSNPANHIAQRIFGVGAKGHSKNMWCDGLLVTDAALPGF